ncbi:MAG: four helix bundle protein [bacterium]
MNSKPLFDHEKLEVYQLSIEFIAWLEPIVADVPRTLAARDNIDRASTSIPLNTAEGNGRYTENDRCRFFDIARGSALECAACLDVLVAKRKVDADAIVEGKVMLARIVSMLVGLIKSNSPMRVHEDSATWG